MLDNASLDRGAESNSRINFHKFQALIYFIYGFFRSSVVDLGIDLWLSFFPKNFNQSFPKNRSLFTFISGCESGKADKRQKDKLFACPTETIKSQFTGSWKTDLSLAKLVGHKTSINFMSMLHTHTKHSAPI